MSSTRTKRSLRDILLDNAEKIKEIAPDLVIYLNCMGDEHDAKRSEIKSKITKTCQIKFQDLKSQVFKDRKNKDRPVNVVELVSTDGSEVQQFPEMIILYHLYKRFEAGPEYFKNNEKVKYKSGEVEKKEAANQMVRDGLMILQKSGNYSFEWMNYEAKNLLSFLQKVPFDSDKAQGAIKRLNDITQRMPKLFWGLGYARAAMLQLHVIVYLAKHNVDGSLNEQIESYRAAALHNVCCARKLNDHHYSSEIAGMIISDGEIKKFILPHPELDKMQDNDAMLAWEEDNLRGHLSRKHYDVANLIDKPVSDEMRVLRESNIASRFLNDDLTLKDPISALTESK